MKPYLLCVFIYFMVSWSTTFGYTTTWQPAFDVSAGRTKTLTTVRPTKPRTTTESPIMEDIPSQYIPRPAAPPCNLLRPISCFLQKLEYFGLLEG